MLDFLLLLLAAAALTGANGYQYYYDDYAEITTQPTSRRPTPGKPTLPFRQKCSAGAPLLKESRYTMLGSALMIFPAMEVTCEGEIAQWEFLPLKRNTSQVYFAVWHRTNAERAYEFGLRGMNNPNITATPGRWNKWTVPVGNRIFVKPGDVIGYFYVNWVVNTSELIIPLAVPLNEFDKSFFKTVDAGVFAAMLGLPDVVQRFNGVVDFATVGVYLPAYAIPPLRAIITPRTVVTTTVDPFQALAQQTLRDSILPTTRNPDLVAPVRRCEHLPTPFDKDHQRANCRPERFIRYFFSQTLRTCVFFYYSACTDIPGQLPYSIRTGNNFDTAKQCLGICAPFVDKDSEPVLPPTEYDFK